MLTKSCALKRLMNGTFQFIFFVIIIVFFTVDINRFLQKFKQWMPDHLKSNLLFFNDNFFKILVFILIFICMVSFAKNKYSIKVEQFSLGGINILFDKRRILFVNSVRNFFDSKRTLFNINEKYDNFSEVFQSYHDTYNFLRQEIRILDPQKDKDLYNITNQIFMKLNQFLTRNQNNYSRWYKYISETNQELIKLDEFDGEDTKLDQRHFYNLPIDIIQSKYYLYDELTTEFKNINLFFMNSIAKEFDVDISKWDMKEGSDQNPEPD